MTLHPVCCSTFSNTNEACVCVCVNERRFCLEYDEKDVMKFKVCFVYTLLFGLFLHQHHKRAIFAVFFVLYCILFNIQTHERRACFYVVLCVLIIIFHVIVQSQIK